MTHQFLCNHEIIDKNFGKPVEAKPDDITGNVKIIYNNDISFSREPYRLIVTHNVATDILDFFLLADLIQKCINIYSTVLKIDDYTALGFNVDTFGCEFVNG